MEKAEAVERNGHWFIEVRGRVVTGPCSSAWSAWDKYEADRMAALDS